MSVWPLGGGGGDPTNEGARPRFRVSPFFPHADCGLAHSQRSREHLPAEDIIAGVSSGSWPAVTPIQSEEGRYQPSVSRISFVTFL